MQTLIFQKIIKVGTSLAVVVPANVARTLGWARGDIVSYGVYDNDIICITKIDERKMQELRPQKKHE